MVSIILRGRDFVIKKNINKVLIAKQLKFTHLEVLIILLLSWLCLTDADTDF